MCKNSLFIPQSMKSKQSFLFYFKIAKELSEFRNYLCWKNAYLSELNSKLNGIKATTKKYRMTLEPSSYVGGNLGRVQIAKADVDQYGVIVGVSFGGDSTAPGNAHVLYESNPNDTWVYASCVDAAGTLRVSFIKT